MKFTKAERKLIYARTSGYCHICGKKLAFNNYGLLGLRGAWEIDHSNPSSVGGTNKLSNLFASCISCNRIKGNNTTVSIRYRYGRKKAPLSREKRKEAKNNNAIGGTLIGGIFGSVFGPWGILIGGAIGGKLGYDKNPDN